MTAMNGKYLPGSVHYQYDDYVTEHETAHSSKVIPEEFKHYDKYFWDKDEETERLKRQEELDLIREEHSISDILLAVLTDDERLIVVEHIWNGKKLSPLNKLFPQKTKDGEVKLDVNGNIKYHDHHWVKARYMKALSKMREAAKGIPLHKRIATAYPLPGANLSETKITERVKRK